MFSLFQSLDVIEEYGNIKVVGFNPKELFSYIDRRYKTSRITNHMFDNVRARSFTIHSFFAVELLYILEEVYLNGSRGKNKFYGNKNIIYQLINLLKTKTWLKSINEESPFKVNMSRVKQLNFTLKDYQNEFVEEIYLQNKFSYKLDGYLLAFDQGLGKSLTSLALFYGINKKINIILCPKSTIDDAWINEINKVFKEPKKIWASNSNIVPTPGYDYYIVNYESIDKLTPLFSYFAKHDISITVDECHNYKDTDSVRTQALYIVKENTGCTDILLMSGTPIKAMGKEMIPILRILDKQFDQIAETKFKAIFGQSVQVANEIMCHRLGKFMHRKVKKDVVTLPEKTIKDHLIKIPNGEKYTLKNVKNLVKVFREERQKFYDKNYKEYLMKYENALKIFEDTLVTKEEKKAFKDYKDNVKDIIKYGYSTEEDRVRVMEVNKYEKKVIIPALTGQIKKDFIDSRSVIKYVELKILGEVIGGLLNKLRSEMFQEMIVHSDIIDIINDSAKKTICFTTYVDVADSAYDYLTSKGYKPLLVKGDTSKDIKTMLEDFKSKDEINPCIATIQTMSTGVTIVEANTVIFLNVPWRQTDFDQASDRVFRIGQDTDVNVFKFILDTGKDENLSTRMESILAWSKQMFDSIVDGEQVNNFIPNKFNESNDMYDFIKGINDMISKFKFF